MNLRRSRGARVAVSLTAMALLAGPTVTGALAQESPSPTPEATPEAVTTAETSEGTDDAPKAPLPLKDNTFALGQAMQIRVNADGEPNSNLLNFRWTVSQLTVQGPPDGSKDGSYDVPVPEGGDMPRYLENFGKPPVENGVADWTVDVANGAGVQRTVSLFPQDAEPKIALETRFTLDGQEITAQDLVGKSGVVTAQYTLINRTTAPTEVTVTDLAGNPVTKTVTADVPMIAIAKTLIPQRYTGLNTGAGQFGSDGRGNNQVQFIALPFRPLSKDGTATFGWSANVTDAVIPSMLLQVAPLYLPAQEDDPATPEVDESKSAKLPVNLDPAIAEIQAGLASVIAGVQTLTSGGTDPLDLAETGLNNFFQKFGTNIQQIAAGLDPANPEGATAGLVALQGTLTNVGSTLQQVDTLITPDVLDKFGALANVWPQLSQAIDPLATDLPVLITALESGNLNTLIDCGVPDPANDSPGMPVAVGTINKAMIGGNYQGHRNGKLPRPTSPAADYSYTYSGGLTSGGAKWSDENGDGTYAWEDGGLPSAASACRAGLGVGGSIASANPQVVALVAKLKAVAPVLEQLANVEALDPANAAQIQQALTFLQSNLGGALTVLAPEVEVVAGLIGGLVEKINALQQQIAIIGAGLAGEQVDLPALDDVISQVVGAVLASPGGQQITSGLSQVKGGVGAATTEVANFAADAIVKVKGLAAAGDAAIVDVKASLAGLKEAAATSPLIYGPVPEGTPPGTVLSGAYEFRIDAADTNLPYTPWRILLGVLALVGAGVLAMMIAKRAASAAPAATVVVSDDATQAIPVSDGAAEDPQR